MLSVLNNIFALNQMYSKKHSGKSSCQSYKLVHLFTQTCESTVERWCKGLFLISPQKTCLCIWDWSTSRSEDGRRKKTQTKSFNPIPCTLQWKCTLRLNQITQNVAVYYWGHYAFQNSNAKVCTTGFQTANLNLLKVLSLSRF